MRYLLAFLLLTLPLAVRAQVAVPQANPRPFFLKAPVIGLRGGATSGQLLLLNGQGRLRPQVGWEAAVQLSGRPRRAGFQAEAIVSCLRFTQPAGTYYGARYRTFAVQPVLIGYVRPVSPLSLLLGTGLNIGLSSHRYPQQTAPGAYGPGLPTDRADRYALATDGPFWMTGVRVQYSPNWYVEGRYARKFSAKDGNFEDYSIQGRITWWSVSVGYWLNPRPARVLPN